nr:MAG TPA: hypothetical protein [Caudoviricetes sp.]
MLTVKIWYNGNEHKQLRCLKPRRYMCGWDFERLLKYIKEELYWEDIDSESIEVIEICNDSEHWYQAVSKEEK